MSSSRSKIEQAKAEWAFVCVGAVVLYEERSADLVDFATKLMDYYATLFAHYKLQDTYEPAHELCCDLLIELDMYWYVAFLRRFKAFRECWIESVTMLTDECFASLDRASVELSTDALRSILLTTDLLHETYKHALVFDAYEWVYENGYDAMLHASLLVVFMTATMQIASAELYPLLLVVGFSEDAALRDLLAWVLAWNVRELMNLPKHEVANWQESLATIYSAVKDALEKGDAYVTLAKEFRLAFNPSGTGKNPEYEREKADTLFLQGENDRRPLEREPDPQPEKLQWLAPKRHDPLEHVLRQDEVEHLLNAARGKTRQLVELLLQGFEVHEAAEAIGITPNTAYVLLHKFRKKVSRKS